MKNTIKKQLTAIMSMVLVVAMSLALTACGKKAEVVEDVAPAVEAEAPAEVVEEVAEESTEETAEEVVEDAVADEDPAVEATEVGEGATQFTFEVVDGEGNTTLFTVNTDKETVGEALLDVELIAGDESEYGLYVKTVNGVTADYDVDQTYWAFYVDGEYASTGVDQTAVTAGSTYSFKVEK